MKTIYTILTLLICICSAQAKEKPLSIEIVPENNLGANSWISWGDDSKRSFYVVLTNKSDKEQRVFESWNSWGYQAISFQITLSSGNKTKVSMKPHAFTKNHPSTFTIPPKGHYVFKITFNKEWEGKPDLGKAGQTKVKIKAIYGLSPTDESKKQNVWIGKIESKELDVTINHW